MQEPVSTKFSPLDESVADNDLWPFINMSKTGNERNQVPTTAQLAEAIDDRLGVTEAKESLRNKATAAGIEFDGVVSYLTNDLTMSAEELANGFSRVLRIEIKSSSQDGLIWNQYLSSQEYAFVYLTTSGVVHFQVATSGIIYRKFFQDIPKDEFILMSLTWDGSEPSVEVNGSPWPSSSLLSNTVLTQSNWPGTIFCGRYLAPSAYGKHVQAVVNDYIQPNFVIPTEVNNTAGLPVTIESISRGGSWPTGMRQAQSNVTYSIWNVGGTDNGDGTYTYAGSGGSLNTTSNHHIRLRYLSHEFKPDTYIRIKVAITGAVGGETVYVGNKYYVFDGGQISGITTSRQEFTIVSKNTGNTIPAAPPNTPDPYIAFGADNGDTVTIEPLSIEYLGALVSYESDKAKMPKGHRQWLDSSGNGNHGLLVGGAVPLIESGRGKYIASNVDCTSSVYLIDSAEPVRGSAEPVHVRVTNNSGASVSGIVLQASDQTTHTNLTDPSGTIADGESDRLLVNSLPPSDAQYYRIPAATGATDLSFEILTEAIGL